MIVSLEKFQPGSFMKVLILGGTGVFGSRLARMLLEDGWDVTVAGRSLDKARAFARHYGGTPLQLDRSAPLTPHLDGHFAFVDAAGPFQDYASRRLAEETVAAGVHYLDLSDDAEFTAGISALDGSARARGVAVLSGVSSVPALSSAAVTELSRGMACITGIESAILPGNRAPRGASVMRSILGQAGAPLRLWRDGEWTQETGWGRQEIVELEPGLSRHSALIGAPDLELFPDAFGAATVTFRAGLELGVMQQGLALIAAARRLGLLREPAKLTPVLHWIAERLERFGTDRGGMLVKVAGRDAAGKGMNRQWALIAETGDGPFIPAIPAVILLRKLAAGEVRPAHGPACRPSHWLRQRPGSRA